MTAASHAAEWRDWAELILGGSALLGVGWRMLRRISHLLDEIKELATKVIDLTHLTRYHLGPNGDSPQIHKRIEAIDESTAMIAETVTEHSRRISNLERGRLQ